MRNADPIIWPGSSFDLDKKQEMNRHYQDSINILQTQWLQADIDQRFALGDQELWGSLFPSVPNQRRMFNFNMINASIQMVSGYQRKNRKATTVIPVISPYQKTADQFTKCMYYVHNRSGGYQVYSDAFEQGAVTQGIGFIGVSRDLSTDAVSGEIDLRYIDFKSVIVDPYFRKHDLSDCRFFWMRQYFDKEEMALLYPKYADEIREMPAISSKDDKFYYMPEVYQIQMPRLLSVDEYWYLSTRDALYLIDKESGEQAEFLGDEEDARINKMRFGNRIKFIEKPRQTVRRTIMINGNTMIDEPQPDGLDRYPFVPVLGYFTPDTPYYAYKFRGIVRDQRDAQYLFNRRKVADLDILESQQQGIKLKKGSLVKPEDGLNQGHGRMLVINSGFELTDVEPMPIIPPAPTMLQMEEMLQEVMSKISGINEELLGSAVDDKAGVLAMLRQGAGLTTLQRLFDQFDESQRQVGDLIIEIIQKNWTYLKVKSVIGEEPTPEFEDKAFYKYGSRVAQGVLTETQQQLELAQLFKLQARFGPIFPEEEIIEAMTIQNKDRIIEKMTQRREAAAQQEQQMAQMQMQQMQVDNETKLSYAESQKGLAAERVAKIQSDMAVAEDKLQRARTEDLDGLLSLVKTIKELQGMDVQNLTAKVAMLQQISDLNFEPQLNKLNPTMPGGQP